MIPRRDEIEPGAKSLPAFFFCTILAGKKVRKMDFLLDDDLFFLDQEDQEETDDVD